MAWGVEKPAKLADLTEELIAKSNSSATLASTTTSLD
eukprot:COSAG01_NODE_42478_length_439_cov_3.594118_1_plen_36_part_01